MAVAWLLSLNLAVAAAEEIEQARRMADTGAVGLALALADRQQPAARAGGDDWMAWERLRLDVHTRQMEWQKILDRTALYTSELPQEFYDRSQARRALALLQIGQPVQAREVLGKLAWRDAPGVQVGSFAEWRRLIIRSYLQEGRVEDAHAAMLRYQQDYGVSDADVRLLQGEVLLAAGRFKEAIEALQGLTNPDATALSWLAGLRGGLDDPARILADARTALQREQDPARRRRILYAQAQAAQKAVQHEVRIVALEESLALGLSAPRDELITTNSDELWQAYFDYAYVLGNAAQLLVGEDQGWLDLAAKQSATQPIQARALYALMAITSPWEKNRLLAHRQLSALLSAMPHGTGTLRALYSDSKHFASLDTVPSPVQMALADHALDARDTRLAAALLRSLKAADGEADDAQARLQQARLLIFAGNVREGQRLLRDLLRRPETVENGRLERAIRAVQELQGAGEQKPAHELYEMLLAGRLLPVQRCEILAAMAAAQKAAANHVEAARLYLEAAASLGGPAPEGWSRYVREEAAQMLARAGLAQDAYALYQDLIRSAPDAAQRGVLEHQVRQLGLTNRR